jgi:hypothetical protein
MQYILDSRDSEPEFDYVVFANGEFDYYLYKDFDKAMHKMLELSIGSDSKIGLLHEISFNVKYREYHLKNTFKAYHGKMIYDKYAEELLHVVFYMRQGMWMNTNEFVVI